MPPRWFFFVPLFVAPALSCAVAATVLTAGPSATVETPRHSDVRDVGPIPGGLAVTIALTLRYRHEAELDALAAAQSDPTSPLYRHFLTSAQFDAYFAPAPADEARVAGELRDRGFTVRRYPNRTLIDATAPARVVEATFSTELHAVVQSGHGRRYLNVRTARAPAFLGRDVVAMTGFDNLMKARFAFERATHRWTAPMVLHGKLHGPDGGYAPLAIARGFLFPVQAGYDGSGHSVANVAGNIADSDLGAFLRYFGETRTGALSRTLIDGNGGTDPSDPAVQEATLDIETIGSLAPGANIDLYVVENPVDQPGEDAYNHIVSDDRDDIVNSSFGVCETADKPYAVAAQRIIKQGVVKGMTFVAASGDSGSYPCASSGGGQDAPASIPQVTGVGGTTFQDTPHGKYASEVAWSGSGGGVSLLYTIPQYQVGVPGIASTTNRNVPDIAFPADPNDGASYYLGGAWAGPIGGTSWSSPIFAALQVEINQKDGRQVGNVNPLIYAAFKAHKYTVFHDITSGSNGGFSAKTGYDNVTGIGSIRGQPFSNVE